MVKRKYNDPLVIKEPAATHYNLPQNIGDSSTTVAGNNKKIKTIEKVFESLHELYAVDVNDSHDVIEYLLKYPDLINFLSPMSEQLRNTFGQEAQIILQMYFDPEIDYHYLTICLRFNDYSTNFMEKIESIHEGFDDQMIKISGRLLITTDFFPPKR